MRFLLFAAAAFLAGTLTGTEFFVSPFGQDTADGRSEKTPFKTIQQGMNALQAGDTLTILPGKYHEAVRKVMDGDPARKTVIRAKYPGTVLIHSDLPLKDFKVHDQEKSIYVTECDAAPEAVFEHDTFTLYERADKSFLTKPLPEPGRYHYDAAAKRLYLRTTDARPPQKHVIARSVFPADGFAVVPGKSGKVVNVEIDGLTARGFMTEKVSFQFASWGVLINNAENCLIRRCTAVLNCGGISMNQATRSRIESCTALGNGTLRQVSGGNIIIWSGIDSVIDSCFSFRSRTYGIRFYGANTNDTISRCVSIEDERGHIWIKPSDPKCMVSQVFSPGMVACKNSEHSVFYVNDYDRKGVNGKTSLAFGREIIQSYPESFADLTAFDFRLTNGSKFKQGFAGQNFCYLAPDGDDANDGLSRKTPRKTLKDVPAGAAVYLLPGKYPDGIMIVQNGITLAGYGQNAPAVITGKIKVTADQVTLRKLGIVTGGDAVTCSGSGLRIENCGFAKADTAVKSDKPVTISHCAFAPDVKKVIEAPDSVIRLSILNQAPGSAVLFGNAYPDQPAPQDPAGIRLTAKFSNAPQGDFTLKNESDFKGQAADGTLIGPVFYLFEPQSNSYFNMKILPASSREVTLQFETDAVLKNSNVNFRETGGKWRTSMDRTASVQLSFVSLENLKPNTQYECFAISNRRNRYVLGNHYLPANINYKKPGKNRSGTVKFTTPAADRAPQTFHVSVKGDNRNPGTAEKPLLDISSAALKTAPGDTVIIHEGVYRESVLVPVSGTPDKPITYCGAPGETVWFDGNNRQLCRAFGAFGKKHLRFDSFRLKTFGTALINASGLFIFFGCEDIAVSRVFYDGRSPGYSPALLHIRNSKDISLKNSVEINSMGSIACIDSTGVVLEHNILKMASIWPLFAMGTQDHSIRFAYNIVTDNIRAKTTEPLLKMTHPKLVDEFSNLYFIRLPKEIRFIAGTHTGKKWTLAEYYRLAGKDGGSVFANPNFKAMPKMLTWKSMAERAVDMKKGQPFGHKVNNYEDGRDPKNSARFHVWDFKDFFANPIRKAPDGRIIGLEPDAFKGFSDLSKTEGEWRTFK